MERVNTLTDNELMRLKNSIGNINHDIHVIEQNINNPKAVKEYIEFINSAIANAFDILGETVSVVPKKETELPPGKDCSICQCAKCSKRFCEDLDVCPDIETCDCPITECGAFKSC